MRRHNLFGKVRVRRLQKHCEGLRVALIARVKELSEKRLRTATLATATLIWYA